MVLVVYILASTSFFSFVPSDPPGRFLGCFFFFNILKQITGSKPAVLDKFYTSDTQPVMCKSHNSRLVQGYTSLQFLILFLQSVRNHPWQMIKQSLQAKEENNINQEDHKLSYNHLDYLPQ